MSDRTPEPLSAEEVRVMRAKVGAGFGHDFYAVVESHELLRRRLADTEKERDALAVQLAQEWTWPPEPSAVLVRLRGLAAAATFSDEAREVLAR